MPPVNRVLSDGVVALVVAAGRGVRSGLAGPKQYHLLDGKTVLAHVIDNLAASGHVDRIRVVIHAEDLKDYSSAIGNRQIEPPVTGGATRRESVRAGLEAIAAGGGAKTVLIHDAARPFVPAAVIGRLIESLEDAPAAIPVLPVVDSLVRDGRNVVRDGLMRVQTPQAFRFADILAAHRNWHGGEPTDDAEVARVNGLAVAEVKGDELLRKLTMPEDFHWAENLDTVMTSRTGMGFDVHSFAPGEKLWLGGVEIPHDRGLAGHSDADVALHALTDALLGAIGDGDIGTHFPPSDPQWRGAASYRFVEHARDLIRQRRGVIDHVDITIICEEPKIGPHRPAMRTAIAAMLQVDEGRVSIKATTTEKLGFTGRREGIACQAIATVRLPNETAG